MGTARSVHAAQKRGSGSQHWEAAGLVETVGRQAGDLDFFDSVCWARV